MDESTLLTYIGIGLGVFGIGVTIYVADRVRKLQKREQSSTENIINQIHEITQNQAKIIESMDERRERHIDSFVHHVGGVLESLIESYQELISGITTYQKTRSETNLNSLIGKIESCRMFLIQLKVLAELDIPVAGIYFSNPWISGMFRDTIQLLHRGVYRTEKEIQNMENEDFLTWKVSINYQINEMQKSLKIIKEEKAK